MPAQTGLTQLATFNHNLTGFGNDSDGLFLEEAPEEKHQRYFQVSILFTLSGLAFLLNVPIIVTLAIKRFRRRKGFRNIDFLMLNLSVADVLVAAFCVLADAIWKLTYQWTAGNAACKLVKFMQMFSLYASTFIIVAISVDRCLIINNPLRRFNQQSAVKVLSIAAWISAFLFSIPQINIFRVVKAPFTVNDQELWQCCTHGAYNEPWHETAYVMFTFFVIFAIPLVIIFISYAMIFARLNRRSLLPKNGTN